MQKLYADKVVNLLDLGQLGMVEDALKYYQENKSMSSDEKIRWCPVYQKVLMMVQDSIKAYKNSRD